MRIRRGAWRNCTNDDYSPLVEIFWTREPVHVEWCLSRPSVAKGLVRLASSHFVIVASGLLMVLAFGGIALIPLWGELYAREFGLPSLEKQYGFHWGKVTLTRRGVAESYWGIVSVSHWR